MKKLLLTSFLLINFFHFNNADAVNPKKVAVSVICASLGTLYTLYATKLAIQYWAGHNYSSPFYEFLKTVIPVRMRQALLVSSLLYTGYSIAHWGLENSKNNADLL